MKLMFALIGIVFIAFSAFLGSAQAAGCGDVWVDAGTVRVEKGSTAYAVAFVQNDSEEDFFVDFASVFDLSNNFRAEETGYAKNVPSFGRAFINVKIEAYDFAPAGKEEAFVEVKGHFQNMQSCSIGTKGLASFPVIIEEKAAEAAFGEQDFAVPGCTLFSLIAPERAEFEKSGTVPITIDNRTMDRATVRLSGPGLSIQPKVISVPRNTLYSERISVSSILPATSLVYTIEALGCNMEKSTGIIAAAAEEAVPEEGQNGTMPEIASGLFLLGQAGAVLGLAVLIGIALYLVLRR